MKSDSGIDSFYSLIEGTVLASMCGLIYYAVFFLQTKISPLVNFTQGVDLFFAPAGIKLVAFMLAGVWGFWGIAICGLITAFDVWQADSLLMHVGNILIWAGVPFATYTWLAKLLDLDRALTKLQYWHVVLISLLTTLTSSLGSNLYQYMIGGRNAEMLTASTFAMAIGDFLGTGVCVFTLTFIVKKFIQADAIKL